MTRSGTGRKYLVIVPAGDGSFHREWLCGRDRRFDLMLAYYGGIPDRFREDADYYVSSEGLYKFEAIAHALAHFPEVAGRYRAIFLPDDDMIMETAVINRLFGIFDRHSLDLAQPSLAGGICSYPHVQQNRGTVLRFVDWVEIMCPVFRTEKLFQVLPTFGINRSGWGLELIWRVLLRGAKIAVIDDAAVHHRKRMAGFERPQFDTAFYEDLRRKSIDPFQELQAVEKQYGTSVSNSVEYGRIGIPPAVLACRKMKAWLKGLPVRRREGAAAA